MLILKTTTQRIVLVALVFLVWTPVARAWSWPVHGPVLQPFAYDEAHPYASGQHRGIDIGADTAGENVAAPAGGTVSFAGTVPTNGETVTIETADGYSVTLTHLGSILVSKGATVAEGDVVGTVGPSGTPEVDGPYVHLGIRLTADPNGYVDPLTLLPVPTAESPPTQTGSTVSQPSASGSAAAPAPATAPVPAAAPASAPVATTGGVATTRGSTVASGHGRVSRHGRASKPRADVRPRQSAQRPAVRIADAAPQHPAKPQRHVGEPATSVQRPTVEAGALHEPTVLDAGEQTRPNVPVAQAVPASPQVPPVPIPLFCNGAAALVAVAAAFAAARRRRHLEPTGRIAGAQVLHLPGSVRGPARKAA